jgi:hypothetical protein
VAGRQTTTTKRPEGSTGSCSNKAGEREQSDGLWALRRRKSGKLRSSERNKRDIYRGRNELRALDSTDKHYIQWSVTHSHVLFSRLGLLLSSLVHRGQGPADSVETERESGRPMVYYYYIYFGPTFIQGGFLIENQQTTNRHTDRQTKRGGGFLLSAGCVAWSVGRRMAGWRAPGCLGSWPPRGPHFKERGGN